MSRPSVQKPPLFSPGPILSFEKCSLDPTDALHGPNLILSGCLYNFETNTLFIRLRFVFDIHSGRGTRRKGFQSCIFDCLLSCSQIISLNLVWKDTSYHVNFLILMEDTTLKRAKFYTPSSSSRSSLAVNYSIFHGRYQCINQVIYYSITGAGDYKWHSPLWWIC